MFFVRAGAVPHPVMYHHIIGRQVLTLLQDATVGLFQILHCSFVNGEGSHLGQTLEQHSI